MSEHACKERRNEAHDLLCEALDRLHENIRNTEVEDGWTSFECYDDIKAYNHTAMAAATLMWRSEDD